MEGIKTLKKLPGKKLKRGDIEKKTLFQMWDFMQPIINEGSFPIWDEITFPVIVFQNGLNPPIKNYDSLISEKIVTWDIIPGEKKMVRRKVGGKYINIKVPQFGKVVKVQKKAQKFSEYIINGKYRLFAAVMIHGERPKKIGDFGGGHYTSYIRPKFQPEIWYKYDDMGPVWEQIGLGAPDDIFKDKKYSRPELLFYQRNF